MKDHWIRTTLASMMLATLIGAVFHIPFLTIFFALGIIYITHFVMEQMGTGVKVTREGIEFVGRMTMGIVVFLALRFLMGKAIRLYPINTCEEINGAGGLFGILLGQDISKVILWELMFAFVAGYLAWTKSKRWVVGSVFAISLLILTLQLGFPSYAKTWPDREAVSATLVTNGVVGTTWKASKEFLFGKEDAPPPHQKTSVPAPTKLVAEFPITGEGHATKEIGLKAWLDPEKTYLRPSRPARYVFVEDTDVFFDDKEGPVNTNHKDWKNMPSGKYLVYPLKGDKVYFRWWQ